MPPVQQVQLWNVLTPKYPTVSCQWCYNKVEAIGNNSNSATKISKLHVVFRLAQEQCVESFMEWASMAEPLHPSHTSASAIRSIGCSGVKHATTGFGGCQENGTCLTAWCQVESLVEEGLWCEVVLQELGLAPQFQWKELWMLQHTREMLDNSMLPTVWEQFGDGPFLFQHDQCIKQGP